MNSFDEKSYETGSDQNVIATMRLIWQGLKEGKKVSLHEFSILNVKPAANIKNSDDQKNDQTPDISTFGKWHIAVDLRCRMM